MAAFLVGVLQGVRSFRGRKLLPWQSRVLYCKDMPSTLETPGFGNACCPSTLTHLLVLVVVPAAVRPAALACGVCKSACCPPTLTHLLVLLLRPPCGCRGRRARSWLGLWCLQMSVWQLYLKESLACTCRVLPLGGLQLRSSALHCLRFCQIALASCFVLPCVLVGSSQDLAWFVCKPTQRWLWLVAAPAKLPGATALRRTYVEPDPLVH
jgi:hypothetical protein